MYKREKEQTERNIYHGKKDVEKYTKRRKTLF
jgi:hypothetical protein